MNYVEAHQLAKIIEAANLPDFTLVNEAELNAITREYAVRCEYTGPDKVWRDAQSEHRLLHGIVCWVTSPKQWVVLKNVIVHGIEEEKRKS